MIQVTDPRYLDQIDEQFRGSFRAEVKLFFKSGAVTFGDDDIFSISEDESANIVADENPSQSTEITLSNYNHQFDINASSGYFRDIADGIECQYRFGFNVLDEDGTEETIWLDWKRRWCDGEATLSENQVTFNVTDLFSSNEDEVEYYMSANYGLIVDTVFNKSSYPKTELGTNAVEYDPDLVGMPTYYEPTYSKFNEIVQAIAFASGKQLYIDHKGVVHIDDERTTLSDVHLTTSDYYEDEEVGKTKKVKKITVSYYVSEDSSVDARPDLIREIGGLGDTVDIDNDFICSTEDGNRLMSSLVNYYEKRGTFNCKFRGDPRLEPLDVISIDILNSDGTTQTVQGTIISIQNEYDGNFESTIECRYLTTDQTDAVASITGADNFVYPLESDTPSPTSLTLSCTTSITSPATFEWEYYNIVTGTWTAIQTGQALIVPYNTSWIDDSTPTTFRCTVDDTVSASVTIKRVYQTANYRYLGILDTPPTSPSIGDYYLAETGYVYLWNGSEWVSTTKSDLLMSAVADGKTLTGIENTPLGQLIASLSGEASSPYLMSLSAESIVFQASNTGVVTAGQYGVKSQVSIVHGTTGEDLTTWTLSAVSTEGITAEVSTSGAVSITAFSDSAEFGTVTITAVKNNITLTKQISCSKAKQGNAGENGQDGTDGENGANAQLLMLQADSYTFYTDANGNVKPNQTITLTVQKQNIAGNVVWTNNKGLVIADNTMTLQITSDMNVDSMVTVPPNLITAENTVFADRTNDFANEANAGKICIAISDENTLANATVESWLGMTTVTWSDSASVIPDMSDQIEGMLYDRLAFDGASFDTAWYSITPKWSSEWCRMLTAGKKYYTRYEVDGTYDYINSNIIVADILNKSEEGYKLIQAIYKNGIVFEATAPDMQLYPDTILAQNKPSAGGVYSWGKMVLVNITDNMTVFNQLHLETDDQIREYLNGITYEQFGTEIPAQGATSPWEFTVTADGLTSSVQIGYVSDGSIGEPGEPGTSAQTLLLQADSYNFHTDSEGNVKPNQTITITVQKQNILDDITWADNKGINVPKNTLSYEFKSEISNGQPNPALNGIPTIFTISADGLTSSVQIGYVEDGEVGEDGKSITKITTFYLATSQGSGVTVATSGWTETVQTITETNRYLWIYQDIYYNDGTYDRVEPYISGVYGDKGEQGEPGAPGAPGEPGEATMLKLVASAETFELSSRNVVQTPVTITVEARVSGTDDTTGLAWTITPTLADGYTTGKETTTITTTIPQYSTLTGYRVHAELTGIGSDDVYITGVKTGEPTPRFFEIRATAPTTADNQNEPFITGDFYCTTEGVPMMYDEATNNWRAPTISDKYYDTIMTTVGNYWVSHGNDIDTTVSALYGYFSNLYAVSAVFDNITTRALRLKDKGRIQSTITLPDGTVKGYEVGDGETYGLTGFVIQADGTAEFYNMYAYGITARGSFECVDVLRTVDSIPAISSADAYEQYRSYWDKATSQYYSTPVRLMDVLPPAAYAPAGVCVNSRLSTSDTIIVYALSNANYSGGVEGVTMVTMYASGEKTSKDIYADNDSSVNYYGIMFYETGDDVDHDYVVIWDNRMRTQVLYISKTTGDLISSKQIYAGRSMTYAVACVWKSATGYSIAVGAHNENSYADSIIYVWRNIETTTGTIDWSYGTSRNRHISGIAGEYKRDTVVFVTENPNASNEYYIERGVRNGSSWTHGEVPFVDRVVLFTTNNSNKLLARPDVRKAGTGYKSGGYIITDNYPASGTINYTWTEIDWTPMSAREYSDFYITYENIQSSQVSIGIRDTSDTLLGVYTTDNFNSEHWSLTSAELVSHVGTEAFVYMKQSSAFGAPYTYMVARYYSVNPINVFFSSIKPKIDPSHVTVNKEPLASLTNVTATLKDGTATYNITRAMINVSTIQLQDDTGVDHVYSSTGIYDRAITLSNLVISEQSPSLEVGDMFPITRTDGSAVSNIGSSAYRFNDGWFNNLFANIIGSTSYRANMYADNINANTMDLGAKSIGTNGYAHLPNGLLLQWGRIPRRQGQGGNYDPYNIVFPVSFATKPFAMSLIQEKGDGTRDGNCYYYVYTGTVHTIWNPSSVTNGLFADHCVVTASNWWVGYWMVIGRA